MNKIEKLKQKYDKICNEYITEFVKKHDYEFSSWVSDEVGGIACFIEQYFFCFEDIVYDINNNCPKELIFKWQEDCVENMDNNKKINFKSYCMGLRFQDIK